MKTRALGERFLHEGAWYKVIRGHACDRCDFGRPRCQKEDLRTILGPCMPSLRDDGKNVVFRKIK
jgi:hypothetical protein